MELNRDQIVKALEQCQKPDCFKNCKECAYHRWQSPTCRNVLSADALALNRELTEEIERLRAELDRTEKALIALDKAHNALFTETFRIEAQAKADTVRKMQERIKQDAASVALLSNHQNLCLKFVKKR